MTRVSGRAARAAEKKAAYWAVVLIGYREVVPRRFGDNRGVWPVRVAISKKPRAVAKRPDLESPVHEIVVLDFVQVRTEAHAKLLKGKLDELLLGAGEDSKALRHGWKDIEQDPQIVWPILLQEAVRTLTTGRGARAREIEVFDESEKLKRFKARVRGGVR